MPSDPAFHSNLHPSGRNETCHTASPEPSTATVRSKKLRVYLPHPGQRVQCHRTTL
ncbi:hypothetical protein SRHO_G00146070 [Serrasalmus rhombeus]